MSASSVFDLDQCFLLVMSAFYPVIRGAGVLKGGHDHAKRQQRRQPDRQLVGRNELDDGSGSDRTGPCVAIRLVTRTRREAMSPKQERPGLLPGFFNSPSSLSISASKRAISASRSARRFPRPAQALRVSPSDRAPRNSRRWHRRSGFQMATQAGRELRQPLPTAWGSGEALGSVGGFRADGR